MNGTTQVTLRGCRLRWVFYGFPEIGEYREGDRVRDFGGRGEGL